MEHPEIFPARPAIQRYWQAAFQNYTLPLPCGLGFHVPHFPGPLLSPIFVERDRASFLQSNRGLLPHFNEVLPLGHGQREPAPVGFYISHNFYLGEKKISPTELPENAYVEIMGLGEAVRRSDFWQLLTEGFSSDAAFLRMLLPFFSTLEAHFRTAFLYEGSALAGVITVGAANGVALTLNAVVSASHRGQGVSKQLAQVARALAWEQGAREVFFWTEHTFLLKHAESVSHYRVYTRA